MKQKYSFPKDFLWGAAGAAHQVEGNNTNSDIWLMEQLPGTMFEALSGDACDFYHRYEADIKLLASLGFNSMRFSVEWARIEPTKGNYSTAELNHYSKIVDTCLRYKVTPIITLHHFSSPIWLVRMGGWRSEETPQLFASYAKKVMEVLGDRVKWVSTINEANTPLQLTINGLLADNVSEQVRRASEQAAPYFGVEVDEFAPFFPNATDERSIQTVIDAHRQAVEAIHELKMDIQVGVTLSLQNIVLDEESEEGQQVLDNVNKRFIMEMGTVGDYVGVQNYTTIHYNKEGKVPYEGPLSDTGIPIDPESLTETCKLVSALTRKPIMITEHGIDCDDNRDPVRIKFIEESLRVLHDAMDQEQLTVLGYMHWSFLDNYEWFRGYHGHFGLVGVDFETQERKVRPSAGVLGDIARNNGF